MKTTITKILFIAIITLFTVEIANAQDDISIRPTSFEASDYSLTYIEFRSLDEYPIEEAYFDNSESINGNYFIVTDENMSRNNNNPVWNKKFAAQLKPNPPQNGAAALNFKISKMSTVTAVVTQRSVFINVNIRFGRSLNFDNIAEYIVADILALKPQEKSILLIS
jgi:hypothetical protein